MRMIWIKYSSAIIGIVLLAVFILIGQRFNTYLNGKEVEELQKYGVHTTAKVVSVSSVKHGYDISYEYFVGHEKVKVGDLTTHYPTEVKVGNYYSIVYSKKDPLVRKIDFLKRIEDPNTEFEDNERIQLQQRCNCTSGKITEKKDSKGKGISVKYSIRTDKGGYSKYIDVHRKADVHALERDSFFLVLVNADDYSIQRIFLNTPQSGMSIDTFPSEIQCREAIKELSKKSKETPYIY